jgi:hypothetical protein
MSDEWRAISPVRTQADPAKYLNVKRQSTLDLAMRQFSDRTIGPSVFCNL